MDEDTRKYPLFRIILGRSTRSILHIDEGCDWLYDSQRLSKIFLTFGFLLVFHNFLILYFHEPQGYVIDIYSVLPASFFVFSILCYFISSSVLLLNHGYIKKFAILLLILNQAAILLIPYMLGYYSMGRADEMSYIGWYLQFGIEGSIATKYPGTFIIGSFLSIVSGLPANTVSFIVPIIFSFILIVGLCLLSRAFLKEDVYVNIAIISSFIFYIGIYHFQNTPHALYFAYMPLFIFILFRYLHNNNVANTVLIVTVLLLTPLMHQFIVFFVFGLLISVLVFEQVFNKYKQYNGTGVLFPLFILYTGFFSWFMYGSRLVIDLRRQYVSFKSRSEEGTSANILDKTTEKIGGTDIDLFEMVDLVLFYYGRFLIPFLVIFISYILIYIKRHEISEKFKNNFHFILALYILFGIFAVTLIITPIFSHHPDRILNLNFIVFAQVPLFALSLLILFPRSRHINWHSLMVVCILVCTWSVSLFGTFDSPNIYRTNAALTYNEVGGMEWFYDARDNKNLIAPLQQTRRFHRLLQTGDSDNRIGISDHFGYDSSDRSFADINLKNIQESYIVIFSLAELLYQEVPGYKEIGRYTAHDYIRFRNDNSIDVKVYDNRNIEIYYASKL